MHLTYSLWCGGQNFYSIWRINQIEFGQYWDWIVILLGWSFHQVNQQKVKTFPLTCCVHSSGRLPQSVDPPCHTCSSTTNNDTNFSQNCVTNPTVIMDWLPHLMTIKCCWKCWTSTNQAHILLEDKTDYCSSSDATFLEADFNSSVMSMTLFYRNLQKNYFIQVILKTFRTLNELLTHIVNILMLFNGFMKFLIDC
jgi:hypothetical protein